MRVTVDLGELAYELLLVCIVIAQVGIVLLGSVNKSPGWDVILRSFAIGFMTLAVIALVRGHS